MLFKKIITCVVFSFTIILPNLSMAKFDEGIDYKSIVEYNVKRSIIPSYNEFYDSAYKFNSVVENSCTTKKYSGIKKSFDDLKKSWSAVEWINFGSINALDRHMRISFFPDKHYVGSRQISRALSSKDYNLLEKIKTGKSSYALQGINTADKVIYIYGITDNYSCNFVLSISQNVLNIATELKRSWNEEYLTYYTFANSPEDDYENVRSILESQQLSILKVRNFKIARAYNNGKKSKYRNLEYYSSQSSLESIKINLQTLLKNIKPLKKIVLQSDYIRLEKSIIRSLDTINQFDKSLKKSLKTNKELVKKLLNNTNVVYILYKNMLEKTFGFKSVFNSLDGD